MQFIDQRRSKDIFRTWTAQLRDDKLISLAWRAMWSTHKVGNPDKRYGIWYQLQVRALLRSNVHSVFDLWLKFTLTWRNFSLREATLLFRANQPFCNAYNPCDNTFSTSFNLNFHNHRNLYWSSSNHTLQRSSSDS